MPTYVVWTEEQVCGRLEPAGFKQVLVAGTGELVFERLSANQKASGES